jgi:hypothetical protein
VGGEDDDGEAVPAEVRAHHFEEADAVELGHADVEEDEVVFAGEELAEGGAAVVGGGDVVPPAFEELRHELLAVGFVVNDEDVGHCIPEHNYPVERWETFGWSKSDKRGVGSFPQHHALGSRYIKGNRSVGIELVGC